MGINPENSVKSLDGINSHSSVSVVICCKRVDRLDWLIEAITSLQNQSKQPKEVVVVFDQTEGLKDSLHDRLPEFVNIVQNNNRKGLSSARNTGVSFSSADIVAFLDDDAVAETDWLKFLIAPLEDPQVVGVGGKALPDWQVSGRRPSWFPEEIDWVVGCTHNGFNNNQRIVRNIFGCNMCFRKKQIVEIGGFDSRVGGAIAGDDTDFCLRLSRGDNLRQIIYEPNAVIHHKIPLERQSLGYVANSAWRQGIGKAVTKGIHEADQRALSSEKSYLQLLLFKFLPSQVLQLFKRPIIAMSRIIAVGIVVLSVGTGYTLTRVGLVNARVSKDNNTRID